MSGYKALDAARAAGIELHTDGTDLVLTVPEPTPEAVIDLLRRNKSSILALLLLKAVPLEQVVPWTSEDLLAFFQERMDMLRSEQRLPPAQARALAYETCVMEWLARNPVCTPAQPCSHCCGPENSDDPLLPIGIGGRGEAWLHRACVAAWRAARRAEAISALASLGLATPAAEAPFSVPPTIDKLVLSPRG